MPQKKAEGCVSSAAGPAVRKPETEGAQAAPPMRREEGARIHVSVGKEAPDFEASAYHEGGFKNVRLSDFRGKWVFLCFYPGDFTFV